MFERFDTPAELLEFRLGTALSMEHDSLEMLGELEEAAQSGELKGMFRHHAQETRQQIENLQRVFELLGITPDESPSPTTKGLAKEGRSLIRKTSDALLDEVVLAAALETEHVEIAAYETLIAMTNGLGAREVSSLLSENLEQEKHTSEELLTMVRALTRNAA